ncbi:MAG: APC family permease [Aeromicrobium sp.]
MSSTAQSNKGLSTGSLGLLASVALGVSVIAPAYTLTASVAYVAQEVGPQMPAIFLVGFVPMLLVALGYRELNAKTPDSGTSFTWATKAFGPYVGFMGGWGLIAATVIVLSNLAAIAVDFFYLAIAQLSGNDGIAELTDNVVINIVTCTVFVAIAMYICYRGIEASRPIQYFLVTFQLGVLVVFIIAAFVQSGGAEASGGLSFSWSWFNPFEIGSFTAFAAGVSLSIFVYWGWDTCLTLNEETAGSDSTPGKAAVLTIVGVVLLYLFIAVAVLLFAGLGDTGLGLNNGDIADNVFVALGSPVLGPLAVLMSLAVLVSSASSLQSTFLSPTRTMLAMGHYKALPDAYGTVHPTYKSPVHATIVAGVVATVFYAVMRVISTSVLQDTILTLGLMICFYYGITAFACVWYFRDSAFSNARNFLLRFLSPLVGGIALVAVLVQTLFDSSDPAYGSGSSVFGVGTVFVIGVGIIGLGVALMVYMRVTQPSFFAGETLDEDTEIFSDPSGMA